MAAPWITVRFISAAEPLVAHSLTKPNETTTRAEPVAGWLVQHRYSNADPTVSTDSRVIAGVLYAGDGEVHAVGTGSGRFVGVYPANQPPQPDQVEMVRRSWAGTS